MKFLILIILVTLAQPAFAGDCSKRSGGSTGGAIIGGIIGGILGHQVGSGRGNDVATVVGAIGGAIIGGELGCEMEQAELDEVSRVHRDYMFSDEGYARRWNTNRYDGEIVYGPRGSMQYDRERIRCRHYTSTIRYYGKTERTEGVVCRFPDGSYRDVDQSRVILDSTGRGRYGNGRHTGGYRQNDTRIVSDYQFQDFMNVLARETFTSDKFRVVNQFVRLFSGQGKLLTYEHARQVMIQFTFSSDKLKVLSAVKPVLLSGSGSVDSIVGLFEFESDRRKALNILFDY